jgi:hypothetical protein
MDNNRTHRIIKRIIKVFSLVVNLVTIKHQDRVIKEMKEVNLKEVHLKMFMKCHNNLIL